MITVIAGTNRRNSQTLPIARQFFNLIQKFTDEEVKMFSLEHLPLDLFHTGMYKEKGQSKSLMSIQNEYIIPASKFYIVFPEYNGSYPGVLKLFIDACSIREYKKTFDKKKVALVGTATGRAGNLLGMHHFTAVMHHVGCIVMPNKLPISGIEKITNEEGLITNEDSLATMKKHVKDFLAF